jgi:pimeloyl-ACP methyl ester carboxylesterase
LAKRALDLVAAPTLLIVGEYDSEVLRLNEQARAQLGTAVAELTVVAGAGHFFEEQGTLREAATCAALWFSRWLR